MIAPLLLAVDFMNFTYAKNPCSANVPVPAVMKAGSFSYFDQKMGAGFDLRVKSVVAGSLGAGTRQAVVTLVCDFPADGGTSAAYLFSEDGSKATLVDVPAEADWGSDWGAGPDAIRVRFAQKLLYVEGCAVPDCDKLLVRTYALKNGHVVQVYEQTHPRKP